MAEPRLNSVTCASPAGLHRMAYWEWGDPANDAVLLCVHGLTRNGRDFDPLAQRLSTHYRVVCPDVVGRGRSDWLIDPLHYAVPQYMADMLALIARLQPSRLDWVGTSMGGLIGMALSGALAYSATMRPAHPWSLDAMPPDSLTLGRVVLNDVGPELSYEGLQRIGSYVGQAVSFTRFEEAVAYVRQVSANFGEHSDAEWEELTRYVFVEKDGVWIKHYDLRIAAPFAVQTPDNVDMAAGMLWAAYDSLPDDLLIIRGEDSDLLTPATARDMLARKPSARLFTVPNVGHAPSLRSAEQLDVVAEFLLGNSTKHTLVAAVSPAAAKA